MSITFSSIFWVVVARALPRGSLPSCISISVPNNVFCSTRGSTPRCWHTHGNEKASGLSIVESWRSHSMALLARCRFLPAASHTARESTAQIRRLEVLAVGSSSNSVGILGKPSVERNRRGCQATIARPNSSP